MGQTAKSHLNKEIMWNLLVAVFYDMSEFKLDFFLSLVTKNVSLNKGLSQIKLATTV